MLSRLLPAHLDNDFRGYKAAIWIFALITAIKLGLGLVHILSADGGAQTLSHVPLDSYPAGAAQNVVGLFARMGLEQLLLGAIFIVVLLRYRALISLMFLLALVAQAGAFALAACKPLSLTVSSGGVAPMHLVLSALYIAGLGFSLLKGKSAGTTRGTGAR
jgi:hypothetical protein